MKNHLCLTASLALFTLVISLPALHAGEMTDYAVGKSTPPPPLIPFEDARQPISNSTLFDLTVPKTHIRPLFWYHNLPDTMNTILGPLPVGGDVQLYALQIEWAITERFSINALKDGYIDFNADATLADTGGWANLAAGLKYAWLYRPEENLASNVQLIFEAPTGNRDVFQGEGEGVFIPSASVMKIWNRWQFIDQLGFKLPVDTDVESTMMFNSFHTSYAVTNWLFPTFEVNWFRVLDGGDGASRFPSQAGGLVPAAVRFEGNDAFNFGAANAMRNRDLVTFGVGFRVRLPKRDNIDLGFAYEFPVTDDSDSIYKDRFILDAVIRF